ncbi:MAG: Fe-S protein assembly co-chaperone HscB [Alphaproteobacteria bacterium]|nr:Fe-S protein assembly co-chaperone HscB [Alphaproteobacteria bacterium]
MNNIIEFITSSDGALDGVHCWLCQKPISVRALFCHQCGTIQPVRQLDHFARLGLDRNIDLDFEALEKQHTGLKRALDPNRFSIRGAGEKGHASKHLEALEEAYETLRDPLRRGRYWLILHEHATEKALEPNQTVADLRHEMETANEAEQCDRVARKAGQAMEEGILVLMQSLRNQNWRQASAMLFELEGLESILNGVRECRRQLTSSCGMESDIRPKT